MPSSYVICLLKSLQNPQGYRCSTQTVLPGTEELPESWYERREESFTKVFISGDKVYNVVRYRAYQDVQHNKTGRVFGRFFHWYLEPNEFDMYILNDLGLIVFGTGQNTVRAFIGHMEREKESGFACDRIKVDFKRLQPLIPQICGAWIADIKKQYIKSIGCFGTHVDRSEEFKQAAEAGAISTLMFDYMHPRQALKLSVTENGVIVFHRRIKNPVTKEPDVAAELEVVVRFYLDYLADDQGVGSK